ncbi:hypothetical protein Tco_1096155 [Tanacetum coccineum]
MITGKWTTLTRDCNKFVAIFDEHARLGGENDSTWLDRYYKTFAENWGFAFVHYEVWDVLKNHHKRRGVKAVVSERRVRTVEDIEEPNELFQGDTIPHQPGKTMPSKIQRSDSSRSARSSSTRREAFKNWSKKN